jgi:hypothetical protein
MIASLALALSLASPATAAPFDPGVHAQVAHLERSLEPGDAVWAGEHFPEGELFTWEFFGLALLNVAEATRDPGDVARALVRGRELLARVDATLDHAPFKRLKDLPARGGACWLGGRNLLAVRLARLAKDRLSASELQTIHRDSEALHRAFLDEPAAMIESYRGMRWPVDGLFALESLRIHDEVFGTEHAAKPVKRWVEAMRAHLDPKTGLMPSFVHRDGRARDVPRGCALSWSLAVLPSLDPDFAADQWAAYKHHFLRETFGLPAFREYPPGIERPGDLDSGPIVLGLGMSATAFGLAAARANGDRELAARLERLGETLGSPAWDAKGKRYLGGAVPLFDVLSLWVKTVPWGPAEL